MKACEERGEGDKWANEINSRLAVAADCCAQDVVYHNVCSTNFRLGSGIPKCFSDPGNESRQSRGRPENAVKNRAFQDVVKVLECGDNEQATLQDLVSFMQQCLEGEGEAYTTQYMKQRLKSHFGDDILFTELLGKSDIVVLRRNVPKLLQTFLHYFFKF